MENLHALQQAINNFLQSVDIKELKQSSLSLSAHYREGKSLSADNELLAYLTARLPATCAALSYVLRQIPPANSLLDLGAGPGTAAWAVKEVWDIPCSITAVEREPLFIELGKKLAPDFPTQWIQGDLLSPEKFKSHEWALFGYSLGELPEATCANLLDRCWEAAEKGLIVVEPGTPRGYERVILARDYLIQKGAYVLAPCPHRKACPMITPDWCHFSVRLERSYLHRAAKQASLGYEDEKFSYCILTKRPPPTSSARIIRPPLRRGGHVILPLCTDEGLQEMTVSKRHKELYKRARKAEWGDAL